jgi:hypothetical protein
VPEENVHGYAYCWHHPNLGVVSGGVWAWQGFKESSLDCELFDHRIFMSEKLLSNDFGNFTLDNGYTVSVLEPLKRHRIAYCDPTRRNAVNLEYEALMAPALFANGKHFEQAMRVRGEIELRGRRYPVNGYNIRDRSWGKLRPEESMSLPPVTWCTGTFNDGFSFNCTATDHPALKPEWRKHFPDFPAEQCLNAGWIYLDGELTAVTECQKLTIHDKKTLFPDEVRMRIVDGKGRIFNINGKVTAASHYACWWNIRAVICLTKWQCDGLVGYGESQEAQWGEYLYHTRAAAQASRGEEIA